MAVYNIITNIDIEQQNPDGTTTVIPAGSVLNTVLWDGESGWAPPENTTLEKVSD
jgi:hypothetical protein